MLSRCVCKWPACTETHPRIVLKTLLTSSSVTNDHFHSIEPRISTPLADAPHSAACQDRPPCATTTATCFHPGKPPAIRPSAFLAPHFIFKPATHGFGGISVLYCDVSRAENVVLSAAVSLLERKNMKSRRIQMCVVTEVIQSLR